MEFDDVIMGRRSIRGYLDKPVPTELIGLEDTFAESGNYQITLDKFGLSGPRIAERTAALVARKC